MAGKITINTDRCKGCGLCVVVCPKDSIVISRQSNHSGYFPAQTNNDGCTGCAMCAIICPEAVIEVSRDGILAVRSCNKKRPNLMVPVDEKSI